MQKENTKKNAIANPNIYSEIKREYSLEQLFKKNKKLPINEYAVRRWLSAIRLASGLPNNKFLKFYDKDLTIDQIIRIGYYLSNIELLPSTIHNEPLMNVKFTDQLLYFYETGDYNGAHLIFLETKPRHVAIAAFKLLGEMGFCLWHEDYMVNDIIGQEIEQDSSEIDEDLIKDHKRWKNNKYNKIIADLSIESAVNTLMEVCQSVKQKPELKIWAAMILFLHFHDFQIYSFADYNDDFADEGPFANEVLQLLYKTDNVYNQICEQQGYGYSDFPRSYKYQCVYDFDEEQQISCIAFDNTEWYHLKPHEIVENVFNYNSWYYIPKDKKHKDANLNAIQDSVQIIQSYFDLRTGFDKLDLHGNLERYRRKVIRLQKLRYNSSTGLSKEDV